MVRTSTWIALVVLLALVGFSFYLRDRQAKELAAATPTEGMAHLFDVDQGEPTLVRVEGPAGEVVEFSRDSGGQWVLNEPEDAQADQAAAEASATQVGSLRVLSTVNLTADIIGLERPQYTIRLSFGEAEEQILRIGSLTPIKDGYYTQLDEGPFQVVDKFGLDALIGLLTAPPYMETPTPPPSATPPASETPLAGGPTGTGSAATSEPAAEVTVTLTP